MLFRKKKPEKPLCAAVIAAAGSSSRMGVDKIMLPLGEEPVIVHTVRALECSPYISEIIVVTRDALLVPMAQLLRDYGFTKIRKVIRGGSSRTESVYLGISEITCDPQLIAIHDGARPFLSAKVIEDVILQAEKSGASAPAIPVKDTVKRVKNGIVEETVDRTELYAIQTPQVFDADLIRGALKKAIDDNAVITDDCSAVERIGMKVVLTQGEEDNFKLTTQGDLLLAESYLENRRRRL